MLTPTSAATSRVRSPSKPLKAISRNAASTRPRRLFSLISARVVTRLMRRGLRIALVLHPKDLDHAGDIVGVLDPHADPAGLRQHVVRLSPAGGDQLVVQAPRHRQVGEPVAVDMTHLLLAIA